jgi:hypothetical protein
MATNDEKRDRIAKWKESVRQKIKQWCMGIVVGTATIVPTSAQNSSSNQQNTRNPTPVEQTTSTDSILQAPRTIKTDIGNLTYTVNTQGFHYEAKLRNIYGLMNLLPKLQYDKKTGDYKRGSITGKSEHIVTELAENTILENTLNVIMALHMLEQKNEGAPFKQTAEDTYEQSTRELAQMGVTLTTQLNHIDGKQNDPENPRRGEWSCWVEGIGKNSHKAVQTPVKLQKQKDVTPQPKGIGTSQIQTPQVTQTSPKNLNDTVSNAPAIVRQSTGYDAILPLAWHSAKDWKCGTCTAKTGADLNAQVDSTLQAMFKKERDILILKKKAAISNKPLTEEQSKMIEEHDNQKKAWGLSTNIEERNGVAKITWMQKAPVNPNNTTYYEKVNYGKIIQEQAKVAETMRQNKQKSLGNS